MGPCDTAGVGGSSSPAPGPADLVLRAEYQELTRKHLNGIVGRLFAEFTGLRFHIAWAPSLPHDWNATKLPSGCSVCCQLAGADVQAQRQCRTCGPKQLARALNADGEGHRFTCRLGVCNYWFPIRLRGVTVGIAYVQALGDGRRKGHRESLNARSRVRHMNRATFNRAARLLRLIVEHIQTASLADLRKADLTKAQQALLDYESVQTRMRQELNRLIPAVNPTAAHPGGASHAEATLHYLLDRIHQNYAQPITLQECATVLRFNPAYLSALFSRAVGMPFKTYLTEVRMEKARELLSRPSIAISEVAFAAGYASENRFRLAFKKATGLAPKTWRAALRISHSALVIWLLGETGLPPALGGLLPL